MDWYLEDISRLNGQPKRTIGDYVESQGFLVPKRFDSLKDSRRYNRRGTFFRSEHNQEYNGVSGLLESFDLGDKYLNLRGVQNVEEVRDEYFSYRDNFMINEEDRLIPNYEEYCDLTGLDYAEFKSKVSFSIWEKLGGVNRTVFADTSIRNRYHISTIGNGNFNYCVVENGKLVHNFNYHSKGLDDDLKKGLNNLVETFENIRNLSKFDSNHCPIMEFQTFEGKDYFLQYHRGRDFEESKFVLDRYLEDGEIEVPFVRGATLPEGIEGKILIRDIFNNPYLDLNKYVGCYAQTYDTVPSEIQMRDRNLLFLNPNFDMSFELVKAIKGHFARSSLFKPKVSLFLNSDKLNSTDLTIPVNVKVISDGKRAFLKRI